MNMDCYSLLECNDSTSYASLFSNYYVMLRKWTYISLCIIMKQFEIIFETILCDNQLQIYLPEVKDKCSRVCVTGLMIMKTK